MTGLRVNVAGADFSRCSVGHVLQLTQVQRAAMIGEYLFGGNRESSRGNGVNPNKPLSVTGATFGSNYAALATDKWYDTGLYESNEQTWIICADAANANMFLGNYDGTNSTANTTIFSSGGFLFNTHATDNTVQQTSALTATTPLSDYRLLAARTQGSVNYISALSEFKGGVLKSSALNTNTGKTRSLDLTRAIAIGSARGNSAFPGPVKVAAVCMWTATLTDPELASACADITAALATRGIAT
jgi:hypothetical protein